MGKPRVYHIAPGVDPGQAPALQGVGLSGDTYTSVLGLGSDGFVDVESATNGFIKDSKDIDNTSLAGLYRQQFVSHGEPANEFGATSHALADPTLAATIRSVLEGFRFDNPEPIKEPTVISAAEIAEIEELADAALVGVPLEILFLAPASDGEGPPRKNGDSTEYNFEIAPPIEHPLTGDVFWFAELLSPAGPTTKGLTVTPNPGDPLEVKITVDGGLIGDVIIYGSYQTTGGRIVLGTPRLVASLSPDAATLTAIELQPDFPIAKSC